MAMVSVEEALSSGFSLIRRKPGAVLVWGLLQTAVVAAYYDVVFWWVSKMVSRFPVAGTGVVAGAPPVGPEAMATILQGQAVVYLSLFAMMIVYSIVLCAALRAMLSPADDSFAYLRLGMTEAIFVFAWLVFLVLVIIAEFVAAIPLMLIVATLVASKATAAAVAVGVIGGIAFLVGIVYLHLRLGLAWPMIVDTGKFRLFESWTLTRGHAGSMFLIALVLLSGLLILEAVLGLAGLVFGAGLMGGWGSPASTVDMPRAFARLEPLLLVVAVLSVPLLGAVLAIFTAPWAYLYRRLGGEAIDAPFT
jgi:hypothetical protein